jgi:hypothetical protein
VSVCRDGGKHVAPGEPWLPYVCVNCGEHLGRRRDESNDLESAAREARHNTLPADAWRSIGGHVEITIDDIREAKHDR